MFLLKKFLISNFFFHLFRIFLTRISIPFRVATGPGKVRDY